MMGRRLGVVLAENYSVNMVVNEPIVRGLTKENSFRCEKGRCRGSTPADLLTGYIVPV